MGVEFWVSDDVEKIRKVAVSVFISLFYPLKHRAFEALTAGVPSGHPLASASCCRVIVTIVTATTPSNANAATMAIIAIDVVVVISLISC